MPMPILGTTRYNFAMLLPSSLTVDTHHALPVRLASLRCSEHRPRNIFWQMRQVSTRHMLMAPTQYANSNMPCLSSLSAMQPPPVKLPPKPGNSVHTHTPLPKVHLPGALPVSAATVHIMLCCRRKHYSLLKCKVLICSLSPCQPATLQLPRAIP